MENQKLSPLFFFLSLGAVVALIVSVSAFLSLAFGTLDRVFPDILTDYYQYGYANYSYEGVRSALALLMIVFPVYLLLEKYSSKFSTSNTISKVDGTIEKWATYIILFLASITIITDLVILVQYFVSGEITTRFLLKVALTIIVAGIVGLYYVRKLQKESYKPIFLIITILLVFGMIVWSFSVIGSPVSQRKLRIDQRRIEDIQSIQWQVINFWQQKEKLPETLDELNNPISSFMIPMDPDFESGKKYEYKKISTMEFELCAIFDLPMPQGWIPGGYSGGGIMPMMKRDVAVSSMPYPGQGSENWDHDAGRTCYKRTIDPDLYPPYPKQLR